MNEYQRQENSKKRIAPVKLPWNFVCKMAADRISELPPKYRPIWVIDRIRQEVAADFFKNK